MMYAKAVLYLDPFTLMIDFRPSKRGPTYVRLSANCAMNDEGVMTNYLYVAPVTNKPFNFAHGEGDLFREFQACTDQAVRLIDDMSWRMHDEKVELIHDLKMDTLPEWLRLWVDEVEIPETVKP